MVVNLRLSAITKQVTFIKMRVCNFHQTLIRCPQFSHRHLVLHLISEVAGLEMAIVSEGAEVKYVHNTRFSEHNEIISTFEFQHVHTFCGNVQPASFM